MKKSALLCICSLFGLGIITQITTAYDYTNKNQGKVVTSASVDTSIPDRFKPSDNKDIAYRLKVLPYEEYRYHNQYIVIPKMGMVAPIMEIEKNSNDYKNALKGRLWDKKKCNDPKNCFNYDNYLRGGPVIYPGTAPIGTEGNTFIFGHSNYYKNDNGKFKTIFRLTYNLEEGDKIRVYKKIGEKWVFFEYTVTISKLIGANETKRLLPEKGKITISLSACRSIGTAQKRRLNRGELTYIEELEKILNPKKELTKPKPVSNPPKLKKRKTTSKTGTLLSGSSIPSISGIAIKK